MCARQITRGLYKGYISSRPFQGERVPQRIQNMAIKSYCEVHGLTFALSATEYAMEDSFLILEQLLSEMSQWAGIICYSVFQLPAKNIYRKDVLSRVVSSNTMHFALEELSVSSKEDIARLDDIWSVKNTMNYLEHKGEIIL